MPEPTQLDRIEAALARLEATVDPMAEAFGELRPLLDKYRDRAERGTLRLPKRKAAPHG